MGQKIGKLSKAKDMVMPDISEELLDVYVRSEFKAVDSNSSGTLTRDEVSNLFNLMGCDKEVANEKVNSIMSAESDEIDIDAYTTAFKADKDLVDKTNRYRAIFSMVDKDKDGHATKEELSGVINKVASKYDSTLGGKIGKMDTDGDGRVSYMEFLAVKFNIQKKVGSK